MRAATKAGKRLLDSLVAKKWIAREDVSAVRDARRTVEFLELLEITGKLNAGQQKVVDALQAREAELASTRYASLDCHAVQSRRSASARSFG